MKDNIKEGYKDSTLGVIPDSWEVVKLGDISEQIKDGTHATHKDVVDGIPLLSAKDIRGGVIYVPDDCRKISIVDFNSIHKNFILKNGDILLTIVGTIGRVAILKNYENNYTFQRSVGYIRLNNSCLSDFYIQYFQTELFVKQLMLSSNASAQAGVYLGALIKISAVLPPLPEQKKIAEILSTVDKKIDIVEQQIKETKELKKGLMQKLLVKGIGHTKFKDSSLGQIPHSWNVAKLKDIGNIVTGSTPKTSVLEYYSEGEILWASPADLGLKKYITNTNKKLSVIGFEQTRKLPPLSILVTCIGSTIGKIGMSRSWMSTNQQINSIVCIDNNVSEFYYYVIESIAQYIKLLAGVQAVPLLNKTDFSSISVVVPPLEEQKQIAEILTTVDDKIDILEQKKSEIKDLKKGLMQQLLTGKIRVNLN